VTGVRSLGWSRSFGYLTPQPLAPSQPPQVPQSLYLISLCLLDGPTLQDHSGDYFCHMDHCFAVLGQILGTRHLLEYERAEFELGIWMEMKRHREDEARQWVSNK
jgi:hypothetical protein